MWGVSERVRRLDEESRRADEDRAAFERRIADGNAVLAEVGEQLEELFDGQEIAVTSLTRMVGSRSAQIRPDPLIIAIDDPEAAEWLLGRLRAPDAVEDRLTEVPTSQHWEHFYDLLDALSWAGWSVDEEASWGEVDPDIGPILTAQMYRTCMAFEVEHRPAQGELRFQSFGGACDDESSELFSMLDDDVIIDLTGDAGQQRRAVTEVAGERGWLDATRIALSDSDGVPLSDFMMGRYAEWIFATAAVERDVTAEQVIADLATSDELSTFLTVVVGMLANNVLPDCVPSAAALGIAAWCWRNDTAVEAWHLADDVLMARVNIAVTTAIRPHIDPIDGIDWDGIRAVLTDSHWSLPDGRVIAALFGDGWPQVHDTVGARLDAWQHIDTQILGSEATMRLLTIGGSTEYTRHWWGQGRWRAICTEIVRDAMEAGIALPSPYDERGQDGLLEDLGDPSQLSDDVLAWLIDMPDATDDGPRGLRMHESSRPPTRLIAPVPDS
ncbi:hypothetical protein CA951_31130 [Rhodococcus sp. NCIMB 12038]|nr:hypothetical protein CA951_31130 [Rhodococcus sp. NCIMB 12038]